MRLLELEAKLQSVDPRVDREKSGPFSLHIREGQSATDYRDRVRECQQFIAAGDIYQANLSHRFQVDGLTDHFSSQAQAGATVYRELRK